MEILQMFNNSCAVLVSISFYKNDILPTSLVFVLPKTSRMNALIILLERPMACRYWWYSSVLRPS